MLKPRHDDVLQASSQYEGLLCLANHDEIDLASHARALFDIKPHSYFAG